MIPDLKYIVYSYLTLEEVLIQLKNNIKTRDIVVNKYFEILPDIIDESEFGNIETVKYLANNTKIVFNEVYHENAINTASAYGHLEIVKFLLLKYNVASRYTIDCASSNGHFEIVKFLIKNNIEPSFEILDSALLGKYFEIADYLIELGIKPSIGLRIHIEEINNVEVIQYLVSKGFNKLW